MLDDLGMIFDLYSTLSDEVYKIIHYKKAILEALMVFAEHFHVFIGDLSQDVESHQLREAFTPFGEIS